MSILEALVRQYERLHASGEAPPYGFSRERVSFAIVLSHAGEPVAVSPLSEACAQSPARRLCEVPHPVRRTSRPSANFLWDKTAYVFGVKRHPVTRRPCPANGEHDAFRELHEALLASADDDGLRALLRFLRAWDPNDYDALPHAESMLGSNVIFRLEGERDWLHERPEARSVWAGHLARAQSPQSVCLVTGARVPIALVHPAIKGVPGTHAAGAALVTFNLDTFESYGKTQGANAPISIQAAFAYSSALNALLAFDSRRRIRIGEMTVVFWAEAVTDDATPRRKPSACSGARWPSHRPMRKLRARWRTRSKPSRGASRSRTATPQLPAGTRLHILGLAANVGRLSVRLWHVDTSEHSRVGSSSTGTICGSSLRHGPNRRPHAGFSTRPLDSARPIASRPRSARRCCGPSSDGGRYPRTMLAAVIARVRADKAVTGAQAAICRACLARDHRLGFEREDAPVSLDRDETAPRLSSRAAVRRVRACSACSARQRSMPVSRTASSAPPRPRPATVFPLLARKCAHHITSLRRREKNRGLAHWYEREIDAILDGVGHRVPEEPPARGPRAVRARLSPPAHLEA